MPRRARQTTQPVGTEPAKPAPLPTAEQLKRLGEAVNTGTRDLIGVGRMAAERSAVTLAAKAASARRELTRASAAHAHRERLESLRARAAAYTERARQSAEQTNLAGSIEKIGAAFGQRPAAYGRAVDERGRGHADVPVAIMTEAGETLATGHTDEEGYFAISQSVAAKVAGDVVLQVGKGGALGTYPLTSRGRLVPPREIIASGPRSGGRTKTVPKKG